MGGGPTSRGAPADPAAPEPDPSVRTLAEALVQGVTGGPTDVAGPAWAGTLAVERRYASPVPAPDLRPGVEVPTSVRAMVADRVRV